MRKIYRCTCKDWEECMPKMDNIFMFAWTHGVTYKGKEFGYCPWCGKMLTPNYMGVG